jgi:hypothetical protein
LKGLCAGWRQETRMIEIAGLTILVLLAWAALALGLVLLKALLWLVLLPIRLVFYLFLIPLVLFKAVVGGILLLIVGPIMAIAALAAGIALAAAIIVPLLPLLFIALAIWFVVRVSRGAPALTRV